MLITVPQDESDGLIIANINESRFHCELLPVLGQVELFTDSVQGRSHFRKGPGGGILTLVPDPDNWNAPACFSLCYFCLTHLVVHWISIFVPHNYWKHPWVLHHSPLNKARQFLPGCSVTVGKHQKHPRRPLPAHGVNMSIFPHCSITSVPQLQTKQQELGCYSRWPVHLGCAHTWTLPQLVAPAWQTSQP